MYKVLRGYMHKDLLCMSSEGGKISHGTRRCNSATGGSLLCDELLAPAMMALRRLSLRAPKGVRQMSGHSIEEAIGA